MNIYTFVAISALCSTKTNAILEFAFENLMSYHTLLKAFIDDPEMAELYDILHCANKYAVDKGITVPHQYELNYNLKNETEEECAAMIANFDDSISMYEDITRDQLEKPCTKKVFDEAKNFVTRNTLLIQVELNED